MIPILYAKNASDFSNNGIGLLRDAVSCAVTEERNGAYTVTLKYPMTGNWFSSISEGSVIKTKPNEFSDPQLFRIYKSSKPINGIVTFYGNHISYDLSGIPVMSLAMENTLPADAITEALEEAPIESGYTAWSDIESYNSINITEPRSARALIGGQAGSVIDVWGGELEFDNFAIKLHRARGANNGVVLRYGKNITDAKQERNIEACYTHICPYAVKTVDVTDESGEIVDQQKITVTLTENVIQLIDPHDIGHSRAMILDMTDKFGEGEEITEQALRTKAETYIDSHDMGTPTISITVKFIQIWDTPEYEDFAALERVKLCDTVTVRFEELGIESTAKVVKTVYDALGERYDSIEVGSIKKTLADSFGEVEEKIKETADAVSAEKNGQRAELNNAIVEATNRITGNAGGYVVLHPANYPSEILVMNTNSIQTATKVWRWNSSGLGYSENGYNGPYGLAITMDGSIVADYITTGTMTAIRISGCTITGGSLNIGSGKFLVDTSGNAHTEGYVKATSGEIGGCSIVNGILQVPAARITGTLSASQIDATNLHVSAANIDGTLSASQIDATSLHVSAANIDGTISASKIDATNLHVSAANIDGTLVASQINGENLNVTNALVKGMIYASSLNSNNSPSVQGQAGITISGFTFAWSGGLDTGIRYTITLSIRAGGTSSNYFICNCDISALLSWSSSGGPQYDPETFLIPCNIRFRPRSTISPETVEITGVLHPSGMNWMPDITASVDFIGGDSPQHITVDYYNENSVQEVEMASNTGIYPTINASRAYGGRVYGYNLGNSTHNWDDVFTTHVTTASSRVYKKDIEDLDERHELLFDALRPRRFKFINGRHDREHYGLILDELRSAMDAAGLTTDECGAYVLADMNDPDGEGSIRYTELTALLINEVQKIKEKMRQEEENGTEN